MSVADIDHNRATVYAVHSLLETEEIVNQAEHFNIKRIVKSAFITCWVFTANLLLDIVRRMLFKNKPPPADIKNIVVYMVGILGDNVVMLPALAALRRQYSQARITVITNCQTWGTQIAEGILGPSSLKDRLITLSEDPVRRSRCSFLIDREKFAGVDCDLFVNLSPFGNRGWFGAVIREMAFARLLGALYAVGFRMSTLSRGWLFNDVQYRFVTNEPRRYMDVIAQLGLSSPLTEDLLGHNEEARQSVVQKLKINGINSENFFVVNPGAKFVAKCWPAERFGKVAEYMSTEYEGAVVVTGTSAERVIAGDVVRFSGGTAINLAGETTVQELVELLRLAKGCITNDTGTMHLAAMVGVPTVAIFSLRHSPSHWLPIGDRIVSMFSIFPCRYCYDDYCTTGECLQEIKSSDVIEQISVSFPSHPLTKRLPTMPDQSRQHVLITLPVLHVGGTEVQTLSVIRVLGEAGYRITVCCYHEFDTNVVAQFEQAGARVVLLRMQRGEGLLALLFRLRRFFREEQPDIVHVQYLAPGLIPIIAARLAGVKTVFATVHQPGRTYGVREKLLLRFAARLCTAFFCNSLSVEESWFGSSAPFDPERVRERRHWSIHNAVDVERIKRIVDHADSKLLRASLGIGDRPVVGCVGRLRREKGQAVLLDAMAAVMRSIPDAVLLLVGDGPDRETLRERAKFLGIAGSVLFLGRQEPEEVYNLFSVMDVVAVPSLFEGFGLTAAEAMAAARPVVASAVDGLAEVVVNAEIGTLVPANNAPQLAASLISLLTSRDKAREMGRNGQKRAKLHFSLHKFSERMLAAYSAYMVTK